MITAADLRDRIDAFLTDSGMTPTQFGREALRDPSFVFNMRAGRSPQLDTAVKVISFIEAQEKVHHARRPEAAA